MTCVHPQHPQPYENNLCNSEFLSLDFGSRLTVDMSSQRDHLSASSLPSINSLVGTYTGDFDAYSCQITTAPVPAGLPSGQESPFKLDDFQVYGCYPGTFTLGYLDEALSAGGSDYIGSPTSAPSPSTPGFQSQPASGWDSPFGPYSPSPGYWVADKTAIPQPPSFFTFGSGSAEDVSPLGQAQPQLAEQDPFTLTQQHPSPLTFPPMTLEQAGTLDVTDQLEENLSPKARSPNGNDGRCAVCGDNASCQHYGVRTCEGCKGFFKVNRFVLATKSLLSL